MSIFDTLQAARLALVGGVLVLASVEVYLYVSQRIRAHLFGAIGALTVVIYILARYIHSATFDESIGLFTVRMQWASIVVFTTFLIGTLREVAQLPPSRSTPILRAFTVVLVMLIWVDGPITTSTMSTYVELGGVTKSAFTSKSALFFIAPYIVFFFFELYRINSDSRKTVAAREWRWVRIFAALTAVAGINEVVLVTGLFPHTLGLLDVVLGGMTLALTFVLARYAENAFLRLEQAVTDRTRDLGATVASLRGLIAGLPDMVLVVRDERVAVYNERAKAELGDRKVRSIDEMAFGADDQQKLRTLCTNATDTPSFDRLSLRALDGPVAVDIVAVAVTYEGERTVVANARSTRERDEMEQSLRMADRLSSVGTLAAGIAHEINNPMTFVTANVQYCKESLTKAEGFEEEIEALNDSLEGARRVSDIVLELRTFARPEQENPFATTNVLGSLDLALRISGHTLRHSTQVDVDLPKDLPEINGDKGRLSQVFVNLLTNAADAMPSGRTVQNNLIQVYAEATLTGVRVVVCDNGKGMDETDLARAFDPFFTTKEVGSGTGLGLSICHNIIREIGGEIRIESEVGEGTTVTIDLPAARSMAEIYSDASEVSTTDRRILVVDDEELVLKATERMLRHYQVDIVNSVQEAMKRLEETDFDVILCDVMMPDMNGLDFRDQLGQKNKSLQDRVVFFTGGAIGNDVEERLHATNAPVLRKPLDRGRLERAFDKVTRGQTL